MPDETPQSDPKMQIFNKSVDNIVITDKHGIIIYANDAVEKFTGYSRQEMTGKSVYEIIPMMDTNGTMLPPEKRPLHYVLSTRENIAVNDHFYFRRDGSKVAVKSKIIPLLLEHQLHGTVLIFQDIKKDQESLDQENLFKLAIEDASDQIVISNADGIVLFANRILTKITGYTPEEALGKKAGVLWGKLMPKSFYEKMWQTIKVEKRSFSGQITNKKKNGQLYDSELHISPIINQENEVQYFVAIERDITKEKEIDKAKTEFVSLASHQLRTPLSTINWYTESLLAQEQGALNAMQLDYLQEIYHASKRMVGLVNALLNVSRIELGSFYIDPHLSDLPKILEDNIKELQPQIQAKNLLLEITIQDSLPQVCVDEKLMHIIFQNLLTNAIKYTPAKEKISINIYFSDTVFYIVVADTGCGIPKEQQDKIFTKMFRADNAKEIDSDGTGLGLYIVKSILDQAGCTIVFKSEENIGTTFTITIPQNGMKLKVGNKVLT